MSLQWGPLTKDDAVPLAELWAAMEAEDDAGERYGVEDVAQQLANPLLDLPGGTLAARRGRGLVAFALLPTRTAYLRMWGGVHPAHRGQGYGTRLLDWGYRTARAMGVAEELHLSIGEPNLAARKLAERAGFTEARWFAEMSRDLSAELPPAREPGGIRFVTWSPELDEGAMRVRNESFLDHWRSVPHTRETWLQYMIGNLHFLPGSSFLALADGRPVGVVITHERDGQAWIRIVGTLAGWRGRGVASGLLAHALSAFKAQGYGQAALSVDTHNPTGALSVYRRAGFEVVRQHGTYARALTPE